jgi:phosphatidylserine synthase
MKGKTFIVTLNPVDYLTISGIVLSSCSIALILGNRLSLALSLLFLAMLCDALDGVLARKLGTVRDFGRYLDGFVDTFDYLVAPAVFLYVWGLNTWYYGIVLIVFMICGVIRLSVFNQIGNIRDGDDNLSYLGMPVFWSILFVGLLYMAGWFIPRETLYPVAMLVFGLFAFFMILNRSFFKFKSVAVMASLILGFALVFALDGLGVLPAEKLAGGRLFGLMPVEGQLPHVFTALLIIVPAIVGGSFHMIAVSKNLLPSLAIPVSTPLFGANKTLRGFVLMPAFSILGAFLVSGILSLNGCEPTINLGALSPLSLGGLVGLSYVLFELPNSFLKRRMGAEPGETPERLGPLFVLLDQSDSALGVAVMSYFVLHAPAATVAWVVILSPAIAVAVKKLLFLMSWKKKGR